MPRKIRGVRKRNGRMDLEERYLLMREGRQIWKDKTRATFYNGGNSNGNSNRNSSSGNSNKNNTATATATAALDAK